jgi:hypothetical protein
MISDCRHLLVLFALVLAAGAARSDGDERKPTVRIAADKLLKEVLANPKSAASKYEGKIIAVSGPVSMPTASAARFHDRPDAKNTLSVDAGQKKPGDIFNLFVDGDLAKGEAAKAWMLVHGQKIEMIGKVTRIEKDKVLMEDCTYHELEKVILPVVTARNLVAAYTRDWNKANATYGSWNKSKQMILTGVIQDIHINDQFPTATLFLEPRGKFTIQVGVGSSEAAGLKKGDTVKLKADCTGPGHSANEGKILCTGVILKEDEAPKKEAPKKLK